MGQTHISPISMQDMVYPDAASPSRIADEIMSVLSELPSVRRVALFGSLAENRADCWSDVDMYVACSNVEINAWVASSTIISAKPITYYRKFSTVQEPSGRYWFVGESPFNRLDVSFITMEDYQSYLENPVLLGYKITSREVYTSDSDEQGFGETEPMHFLGPATDYETEISSYIYFSLRAIKSHLRGCGCLPKDIPRIEGLQAAIPGLAREAMMSGGCIGELTHQVWDMLEHVGLTKTL